MARNGAHLLDQYYHVFYEELELAGQLWSWSACPVRASRVHPAFSLRVSELLRPGTRRRQGRAPCLAVLKLFQAAKARHPLASTQSMQFLQCRSCSAACQAWPLATVAPCPAVPPCRLSALQALRSVADRQSCDMQCPTRGRAGTHTPAQIMRSCRRASAQWARPGWRIASPSRWVRQAAAPQARPSL